MVCLFWGCSLATMQPWMYKTSCKRSYLHLHTSSYLSLREGIIFLLMCLVTIEPSGLQTQSEQTVITSMFNQLQGTKAARKIAETWTL